jgi:hypothetical protein
MLAELFDKLVVPPDRRAIRTVGRPVYPLPPAFTTKLMVVPLFVAVAVAPEPPPPVMVTVGCVAKLLQRLVPFPVQVKLAIEISFRSVI